MKKLLSLNLPKELIPSELIPSAKGADSPAKPSISDWAGSVVFLFVRDRVLLIKRSESMPSHSGQIAFVGGHKAGGETPWQTAQREYFEETGMDPEQLLFLGLLEPTQTAGRSLICPSLCYLDMDPESFIRQIKSNGEWSEAMLVPFESLKDYDKWTFAKSLRNSSQSTIMFYPVMRNTYLAHSGNADRDHLLWGATANIIWSFFKLCGEGDK